MTQKLAQVVVVQYAQRRTVFDPPSQLYGLRNSKRIRGRECLYVRISFSAKFRADEARWSIWLLSGISGSDMLNIIYIIVFKLHLFLITLIVQITDTVTISIVHINRLSCWYTLTMYCMLEESFNHRLKFPWDWSMPFQSKPEILVRKTKNPFKMALKLKYTSLGIVSILQTTIKTTLYPQNLDWLS